MGVEIIRIKAVLSSTGLELELSLAIYCTMVVGTDTLITVPMNFWCNSDLFKQNSFLAQKLTNLEHFKGNLSNFPKKNLSNPKHESLKCF